MDFSSPPPQAPELHEPVREPVMVAAPEAPQPQPAPRAPDPVEIERALKESGLELVQTRVGTTVEPAPKPGVTPAKRERRAPPADLNEPLVQVETASKEGSSNPK